MTESDRATACWLLRLLRKRRGWSWADQARALRDVAEQLGMTAVTSSRLASLQRTIARWESAATSTVPGERYQRLLAHLYARRQAGDHVLGEGSDFEILLTALAHLGVPVERTQELRDEVMRSAGVGSDEILALLADPMRQVVVEALRDPQRLDTDLIDGLTIVVSGVDRQIGSVPFVRLQLWLAPVVEVCRRLQDTEPCRERLGVLRSQAYLLAGRIAFELREDAAARRWYTSAVEATTGPDMTRRATVRTSYAMTLLHSTSEDDAHDAVGAAVADAKLGSDYGVRARAHALQAEEAARCGRDRDAMAALRLAWLDVDASSSADTVFDADRLRGFEGVCELHIGTAQRAHEHLERSLAALTAPRDQVQRGIAGTDLAVARIRCGDARSATTLLHGCVETIATTGGRVAAQRLRRARRELAPWRTESFVAELDDHIYDTLLPIR